MANVLKEKKYIKSDYENNNNKFWYITMYDDFKVVTEYGRVGKTHQSTEKLFNNEYAATKYFDSKCAEKESGRNGEIPYRLLKTIGGSENTGKFVVSESLATVAQEEIEYSSPETKDLIAYLAKVNIHNIVSNTTITYNAKSGLFETPCGIVTKEGIDEARNVLSKMSNYIVDKNFTDRAYGGLLNEYLMLIPQNVGMKINPSALYTSLDDVGKQNDILDSLEVSLKTVLSSSNDSTEVNRSRLFNTKLNKISDQRIIDAITRKFKETKISNHSCSFLNVKTVYSVEIEKMKSDYENYGSKLGNVKELWHGTRASNVLSILKSGLYIPPSNSSHCTGRLFGNGLYFASDSTKSLNYSYGYWDGKRKDNNCFMFLANVAMGKHYTPKYGEKLPKDGHDSSWAKAGYSGVVNDEYVVYSTRQACLTYLIEFC